ncbi:MAG: transcription antitermination factor NusB [bacterium]|nr:transcription antitermination factor NusB [bacterium]
MKNRSELREIIITVLYQIYIYNNIKEEYVINDIIKENLETKNEFVETCVHGVIEKQKAIEKLANKYLKNWDINRLSKVDKAIISLAIFELMYTDTPNIVCINEAINLAKKYSDDDVVKMINATLDGIYKNEINE